MRPPKNPTGITKKVSAIENPIVVFLALDFKAPPWPPRSTQLKLRYGMAITMIGY